MTSTFATVIGHPVSHSLSPAMHNAALRAAGIAGRFRTDNVAPEALKEALAALRREGLRGASVTVPHKVAVLEHCTELSEGAREIGAVNCLSFDGERTVGHNTDAGGFVRALEREHPTLLGAKTAVLLGGGGAARAVAYGLSEAGFEDLRVIARRPERVSWTQAHGWTEAELSLALGGSRLVVDCTSAGLSSAGEAEIPAEIPIEVLASDAVVCSLVYHRDPLLLRESRAAGFATMDGLGMLLYQGVLAFELWSGTSAPVDEMRRALQAALEAHSPSR